MFPKNTKFVEEVVIPPALIADTRTCTLLKAARTRAAELLRSRGGGRNVVILCSDSAKSMLKAARMEVGGGWWMWWVDVGWWELV